jgi:Lipopolysaccharide-assembly
VAVLPFDNQTPEPTLTQEISRSVREAVEQRLGLRQSSEANADAVVRGSILRYEPDLPVAYTGSDTTVNVTKRQVQITVSVDIYDQKQGKSLWQRSGLTVRGDYDPGQELQGRERALDDLIVNIVEGAQSQW